MKKNNRPFNWSELPDGAKDVLGDKFWDDIREIIPKRGPAIDMYDFVNERVIVVELPGLNSLEQIHLKQFGTELIIEGTIPNRYDMEGGSAIMNERFKGVFQRSITLPFHFTNNEVKSNYSQGLLEIRIKKHEYNDEIPLAFTE